MITDEKSPAESGESAAEGVLRLRHIVLDERGIALNPATGETFRLIGPALPLARLLQQGARPGDLLGHLLATYEIDEPTARRDLDAFLASLKDMRWTEESE